MTALDAGSTVSQQSTQEWTDPKRYVWLLGLIVPLAALHRLGLHELTGLGVFWLFGPILVFGVFPLLDLARRARPQQPARQRPQVARAGPLLPLVHLRLHPDPVRRPRLRLLAVVARRPLGVGRQARPRADDRHARRDRDQHRPRARPQAGAARALAGQGRARADRLRPLLHRAQPRPPRPRRHPGGPGQLAARRELLGLPAAHRRSAACAPPGSSRRAPHAPRQAALVARATTSSAPGR